MVRVQRSYGKVIGEIARISLFMSSVLSRNFFESAARMYENKITAPSQAEEENGGCSQKIGVKLCI